MFGICLYTARVFGKTHVHTFGLAGQKQDAFVDFLGRVCDDGVCGVEALEVLDGGGFDIHRPLEEVGGGADLVAVALYEAQFVVCGG